MEKISRPHIHFFYILKKEKSRFTAKVKLYVNVLNNIIGNVTF